MGMSNLTEYAYGFIGCFFGFVTIFIFRPYFFDDQLNSSTEYLCRHVRTFMAHLFLVVINWCAFIVALLYVRPDFSNFAIFTCVLNDFIYVVYYFSDKVCLRGETCGNIVILSGLLHIVCISGASWFYLMAASDKSMPPAASRDINRDCTILGFYENHDIWHFLSALSLYFFGILLLTTDYSSSTQPDEDGDKKDVDSLILNRNLHRRKDKQRKESDSSLD